MLVSVIVPVYNHGRYLDTAVTSIVETGYLPLEIVIVDDGSTDNSFEIAQGLSRRYPGIVVVLKHPDGQNHGESATRNLAIMAARGEAICALDADDVMLPYRFEKSADILTRRPDVDGVIDAIAISFASDKEREAWGTRPLLYSASPSIEPGQFLRASLLDKDCTVLNPSWLVRKGLFARSNMFSEKFVLSVDYHQWLRMAACGQFAVGEYSRPVALYRRHEMNMWNPDVHDSVRDFHVIEDVLRWARRSTQVRPENILVLETALFNKFRYCVELLSKEHDRIQLLKVFSSLARAEPRAMFSRYYLSNALRFLLAWKAC